MDSRYRKRIYNVFLFCNFRFSSFHDEFSSSLNAEDNKVVVSYLFFFFSPSNLSARLRSVLHFLQKLPRYQLVTQRRKYTCKRPSGVFSLSKRSRWPCSKYRATHRTRHIIFLSLYTFITVNSATFLAFSSICAAIVVVFSHAI